MNDVSDTPVICCAGPPGSGKSSVGAALAIRLGWAVVDQDSATNPLMEQVAIAAGIPFDLNAPRLRGAVREARYACLTAVGRDDARLGVPTVLVAPFTAELSDPDALARLAAALAPGSVRLVLVDTPAEIRAARTAGRAARRDRTPAPGEGTPADTGPGGDSSRLTGVLVVKGLEAPEAIASRIIDALQLGDFSPGRRGAAAKEWVHDHTEPDPGRPPRAPPFRPLRIRATPSPVRGGSTGPRIAPGSTTSCASWSASPCGRSAPREASTTRPRTARRNRAAMSSSSSRPA